MLVKVRNDDPSRLSSTERTVVNWLKSWSGPHAVPGIAVVQCQDADVVVWTPQTCVVVGVHGFTERVNGTLTCAQDEPWTVDGKPAPIDGDADPLERVRRQTVDLAHQLRSAPGREHVPVSGLVLLVPQLGSRVKLEKGPLPAGIDVLIGDGPSSLRAYFTKLAEGADPSWDAAQVGQALGALGFAAAATYSDLVSEGFPAPETARSAAPPLAAAPTVVVPSVPVEPVRPATPPVVPGVPAESAGRDVPAGQQGSSPGRAAAVVGVTGAAAAAAALRAVAGTSESREHQGTPPSGMPAPLGGYHKPASASTGSGAPAAGQPAGSGQPPQGGLGGYAQSPQGGSPAGYGRPAQAPGAYGQSASGEPPAGYAQAVPGARPPGYAQAPQGGYGQSPSGAPAGYGQPTQTAAQQSYSAAPGAPGLPTWQEQESTRARGSRRRRRDLPVVLGLVLVVLVLIIAVACTGHSSSGGGNKQKPANQTSVEQVTTTTSADPTIPSTTDAPACFPLQPCN
ncbi:hypothetical protein ACIP5Y_29210 [Nocardia sp. NPDC088792]|uniref:hypothetical protein n=1 Tax=Nocardia sp. NPDC088792 TaxID=3364332 RepID=UPI00381E4328